MVTLALQGTLQPKIVAMYLVNFCGWHSEQNATVQVNNVFNPEPVIDMINRIKDLPADKQELAIDSLVGISDDESEDDGNADDKQ
jgi:hypothetical protein